METREMLIEELSKKGEDIGTILNQMIVAKETLKELKIKISEGEKSISEINKCLVMNKFSSKELRNNNVESVEELKKNKVEIIEGLKQLERDYETMSTWRKDMYKAIKKFLTKEELKLIK